MSALIVTLFLPLAWLSGERVRRFFLAVIVLNISLPIGVHPGYREDMGAFGALGGFSVSLTTLALAGLYLPRLFIGQYMTSASPIRFTSTSMPLALYLLLSAFSLLSAGDVTLGLYEVTFIFQLLLLHIYLISCVNSWEDVVLIIRTLLIGLAVQGLLMIALVGGLANWGILSGKVVVDEQNANEVTRQINILGIKGRIDENVSTERSRVGGSVGSPNDAASYLTGAIGMALSAFLSSVRRRDKVFSVLTALLGSAALVFTFSRGGWLALVVTSGIIGYFNLHHGRFARKHLIAIVIGIAVVISLAFSSAISARLTEDDNGAAASRVPLMKLAALMIEEHPLLGVGANNFPLAMQEYLTRGFSGEFVYSVHNKYLLVLSETGPAALLMFLWFLAAIMGRGMRVWRYSDPLISPLALGCAAAVAGEMLHMFVDIFRGEPEMQLLCLLSALSVVLERIARRSATAWNWGDNGANSRLGRRTWDSAPA